jgi:hypothetical protein
MLSIKVSSREMFQKSYLYEKCDASLALFFFCLSLKLRTRKGGENMNKKVGLAIISMLLALSLTALPVLAQPGLPSVILADGCGYVRTLGHFYRGSAHLWYYVNDDIIIVDMGELGGDDMFTWHVVKQYVYRGVLTLFGVSHDEYIGSAGPWTIKVVLRLDEPHRAIAWGPAVYFSGTWRPSGVIIIS